MRAHTLEDAADIFAFGRSEIEVANKTDGDSLATWGREERRRSGATMKGTIVNSVGTIMHVEQLISLLGKRDSDSEFLRFMNDNRAELNLLDCGHVLYYDFCKLGFTVTVRRPSRKAESVDLHICTPKVLDGSFSRCEMTLPAGITHEDTRDAAKSKLGVAPIKSMYFENTGKNCHVGNSYWCDSYEIDPHRFELTFDASTQKLEMFAIFHLPEFELMR